ncbi:MULTISPECIES: hypothetical protein [unclassified Streptomyces]|uniref:hypothetical protein n=1 Tax=unclassified Streptomyces TaxID=2593676 RepID=UPI0033CC109A
MATPPRPTAEPTYTRAQIIAALTSAHTRMAPNEDPSVTEALIRATLSSLTEQTG